MSLESIRVSVMLSPKQLDFSSSGGVGDSDATLSRRKSPRTPSSKRTAPEVTEAEEETKKKKQKMDEKKKYKKETKTKFIRIWNEEDELTLLKVFVDYKVTTGLQTKTDWDGFYHFLGSSIGGSVVAKYSKDQVHCKIRKLRSKYLVQMEKITLGIDPNFPRCSDSEIFVYSEMIWGHDEAAMDEEMLKANGAGTENATARQAQQSENGEEFLKEHEEEAHDESSNNEKEADVERLNENRAAKITETTDGEEGHGDNDEFYVVQDAFETLMSHGLSDYQKKMQLEKLLNIGTDKMRGLSYEWKALCVEERRLNLKKRRFSTKLAEACLNDSI